MSASPGKELIGRRAPEWMEHQRRWRFLQDSLEGGNRYRHADYTLDPTLAGTSNGTPWYNYGIDAVTGEVSQVAFNQIVDRNLTPHLSETSATGRDLYAMRLHRTPVPSNVARAVESHLSRIYAREVKRDGPPALLSWWEDVDGKETPIDQWMEEVVAPLLCVLGQLDIVVDRPRGDGAEILTKADAARSGVNRVVAGIILPENMVWWEKDAAGNYTECVVLERLDREVRYRHWTTTDSTLYDANGAKIEAESFTHGFGFVPIKRVFDRRKWRTGNVGRSRYESIAELQRAIYNSRSELILGDVQSSHSLLQGPEQYLQKGAEIPTGPGNVLPNPRDDGGGFPAAWSYLDPPKGAQAEVRVHIQDYQDDADRDGALLKPAGMTSGTTVGQSGISKIADQADGNAFLAAVASMLGRAENQIACMVCKIQKLSDDGVVVTYPKQFDLFTLDDLSAALDDLQRIAALAGTLPETEGELLKRLISVALPGIDDERLAELHDEVDAFMAGAVERKAAEPQDDVDAAASEGTETADDDAAGGDLTAAGSALVSSDLIALRNSLPSSGPS